MEVYVSQINWLHGGSHSFETIRSFNRFYIEEVLARGLTVSLEPLNADVLLFVPTWEFDKECMDEYNAFKNTKDMVFDLRSLDNLVRGEV